MSIPTVKGPPPALMQNALGALTHSGLAVQKEVENTLKLQQEEIDQTKAIIAEQAAKIAALEARIVQINAQKEREIAILRQEKEAGEGYLQRGINALSDKVADQQQGINALNNEVARLTNLYSETQQPQRRTQCPTCLTTCRVCLTTRRRNG